VRLLTGDTSSPTVVALARELGRRYPGFRWHRHETVNRDQVLEGARLAFGEPLQAVYDLSRADVLLTLDADLFYGTPGSVRYARDFMDRRRVRGPQATMNRLYAVESVPTLTGVAADDRRSLRGARVASLARTLAASLGVPGAVADFAPSTSRTGPTAKWLSAVVADLTRAKGRSLIVAGERQPAAVHALVAAMNEALGNVGSTVTYVRNPEAAEQSHARSLRDLVEDMRSGQVDVLLVVGANPAYDAPAELDFVGAAGRVPFRAHLGLYFDETAQQSHWHVPLAHYLEAWGDARAFDGTAAIVQPLIAPLYDGKSLIELLDAMANRARSGYDIVRDTWKGHFGASGEDGFRKAIHDGVIPGTRFAAVAAKVRPGVASLPTAPDAPGIEVHFTADPSTYDGRFANSGWLQELPRPLTKLTWDNAVFVSPATAQRYGLNTGDVVSLTVGSRRIAGPVFLQPGLPEDVVSIPLGYGRTQAGQVGTNVGFNAQSARPADGSWFVGGASLRKTADTRRLVTTQHHNAMEGRDILRVGTLAQLRANPTLDPGEWHGGEHGGEGPLHTREAAHGDRPARGGHREHVPSLSLYPESDHTYDGYKWGMAIDLTTCIGCNACVAACQAENNIPVVGKEQVGMGREMHWIRIDRYYGPRDATGEVDDPTTHFQPVTCMQCENAPCEPVCPVAATVHSKEGLNQMVYNRCVGTRYCSNNCPYKVRRFNFLNYANHHETPVLKLLNNPDVTVRGRGVMEKCSYCVQRINQARIEAKKAGRPVRDGEIVTACQQACPTRAIVFGNIADPNSEVSKLRAVEHEYSLLDEALNTRPRTTYLAKVLNPNDEA
jgi:molybdopterin-containing oxidoreductase family iron-sulfur binding subunit